MTADTFNIGEYIIWDKPIGHGSFSEVYKGYHSQTKQVVAIKCLRLTKKSNRIKFEISIMKNLDCRYIVKLYDVIEHNDKIYMIMEYCSGGTLEKYIENPTLTEQQIHYYIKSLSEGLKYLRKKNILHRDLKPHNLLISEDNILKISDFGLSIELENDKMTDTLCGSPLYMAPEVITSNIYGVKSDLWSVGIIMYQLIYGEHPYKFKNIFELIQQINTSQIKFLNAPVSSGCLSLLKELLRVESNDRISWGEFFMHPWLNDEFIENYRTSQPIRIGKKGLLDSHVIEDYSTYEPVVHSAPTPITLIKNSHALSIKTQSMIQPKQETFFSKLKKYIF